MAIICLNMYSDYNEFASHQELLEMANMQVAAEISEEDAVLAQSLENEFEIQFSYLRYHYFKYFSGSFTKILHHVSVYYFLL